MSKSVLYAANTNTQAFAATGTVVNFGQLVRRYGQNVNLSGGNVVVDGIGYYNIDVNIGFTVTTGTSATIQIFKDGVAVQGAVATITTEPNSSYAITLPAIVRQHCCCESTITVVVSGSAGNITNAAIVVEKE